MILKVTPERREDGSLAVALPETMDVVSVYGAGVASVAFLDESGDLRSIQRAGRANPTPRNIARLVIRESAPFACGPITVIAYRPEIEPAPLPAPWED